MATVPEYFDTWPHEPTAIIREALREYVGDGEVDILVALKDDDSLSVTRL